MLNEALALTALYGSSSLTVGSLFSTQALLSKNSQALAFDNRTLSYGELAARVNQLTRALGRLGVKPGDRLAVISENRLEYIELLLSAARLGAIVACQNWRQTDEELGHCLELVSPVILIYSSKYAATVDRLGRSERKLLLGDEYERLLARESAFETLDAAAPEDIFIILYTSGTTGAPKAAAISHRAMIARCAINNVDGSVFPDRASIYWSPFFHIASTEGVLHNLLRGGKAVVFEGFDIDKIKAAVAREQRIGLLQLMPGTIERALQGFSDMPLEPGTVMVTGAMADLVPGNQIAAITSMLQAPFRNTFGSTETGAPPAGRGLIPIGTKPERLSKLQSSFCHLRLVGEDGHEVGVGVPGEVAIRGPSLFSGYWGDGAANAEAFRQGWYHMGDVLVRNEDGSLDFVDRRKYLIKSGGENIYPAEIERYLLASPRIAEAVVVRRSDPRWGEVPVAFVVKGDDTLTSEDVLNLCRGRIANYKLPKHVSFVAHGDLPRSATGKIQRFVLERGLSSESVDAK
ncbi:MULTISPECIES: AMP-binding protein [unclassified Variovorax]|uniref:class I adenylate-forming enzyme family protein n=1 Tax=unclassified Variovorax TaxID=663243 RepID=UPI00076DA02B|nr:MULTISPECIES: AMP-binding protein [unclassified Variovorax]KWT82105.1 Long-chain-fatty-acid--CoA ligase [Variovorax sp. WDL1]PNG46029.1 Long-chain-fatty-acid--CoA ligase FadD13 [Variovorax sp. B2]PNG46313.1 Long-chain-fatty-acid--CoA ligase FadD13 [Variovorax sp. B4]VTV19131.1 Long-chain-fatty-acid--CoA ligase FadD13 [Variovorax sp. WDL1]